MDNIYKRHANIIVLSSVLLAQMLGLAIQVRRPADGGPLLIRTWAIATITPLEKAFIYTQHFVQNTWHDYFYLRDVRKENQQLREELERARLEQVRLHEDAAQAHRLQALLQFKEQYIAKTVAAQVIGTSGSEQSRVIYIDRGTDHGVHPNMAVITPEGVVGKVLRAYGSTSQVLEITDQTSGVGATLEKTRLQGILKGSPTGGTQLQYIMSDEKVELGDRILTSGGDSIFPKGLPIGTVQQVSPGKDLFLNVQVKPIADLARLEEVLVITQIEEREPSGPDVSGPLRASDILAERLPSVPVKPETPAPGMGGAAGAASTNTALSSAHQTKPASAGTNALQGAPVQGTPAQKSPAITKPADRPDTKTGVAKPATGISVPKTGTTTGTTITKPATNAKPKPPVKAGETTPPGH